jgi:protein SCO1/2
VSRSPGGRRRAAGERGGDQTAAAGEGMLGGMCEPQAGRGDRSGLTDPLGAVAMQRDDQTFAGSPGEECRREQQRRQQVQDAFDQDVGHGHDGGSYRPKGPSRRDIEMTQPPDLALSGGRFARMTPAPERKRFDRRMILPLIVILVIAGGFALLLQSTGHNSQPLAAGTHSARSTSFLGDELSPPKTAPPLSLRNYLGERINIDQYRGKALLVTFIYDHCPDVCPLIVADLRAAQIMMGPKTAARAQIVAVSVDPRGDTPKTVAAFLKVHEMTGRMKYLIGSASELGQVWQRWGVGSERDAEDPDIINHSALVYGIDASGELKTVYIGGQLKPSEVAHDVPLLASQ